MNRVLEILALLAAGPEEAEAATLTAELADLYAQLGDGQHDADIGEVEAAVLLYIDQVRAGEVEEVGATDVTALRLLVGEVQNLRALASQRIDAAAEVDQEIAALEALLNGDTPTDGDEDPADAPAAAAATTDDAEPTEPAAGAPAVAEPESVTAAAVPARVPLGRIRERQPAPAAPTPPARPSRVTITATHGGALDSMTAAANVMSSQFHSQGLNSGWQPSVQLRGDYPESHRMDETDSAGNARKLDAITAAAGDDAAWTDSIVAAGGWCTPPEVDYSQIVQSVADTPFINSMPSVLMPRGGVRVAVSPTLSTILVSPGETSVDGDAIGVWTEDMDTIAADPLDPDYATTLKPIQWIDCPDYAEFRTRGVTAFLGQRNMASRANPENVASWNTLMAAAYARKRETLALDAAKNDAATTNITQPVPVLGAAIDIIELLLRLGAGMRSAERSGAQTRLRVPIAAWVVDLMAADMARSGRSVFNDVDIVMARNRIVSMLGNANITPTFYLDSPSTGTSQLLRRQVDGHEAHAWPTDIQFGMYFEGYFAFGDSGQIDFGTLRDLSLVRRNEYVSGMESFDGLIARRGPEALWVTQAVSPDGSYAAPVDAVVPSAS